MKNKYQKKKNKGRTNYGLIRGNQRSIQTKDSQLTLMVNNKRKKVVYIYIHRRRGKEYQNLSTIKHKYDVQLSLQLIRVCVSCA